ncbi:unnamed protein product, partial [Iphiclides podalirius]
MRWDHVGAGGRENGGTEGGVRPAGGWGTRGSISRATPAQITFSAASVIRTAGPAPSHVTCHAGHVSRVTRHATP